jgi:hypothetical protein
MQFTLKVDSGGRVAGTIEHNGAHATVTGSDPDSAIADLRMAVESAVTGDHGECFWHEARGDTRWLFRRQDGTVRVAILWSMGTLTGWEHRFWAECEAQEFRDTMRKAMEVHGAIEARG